MLQVEMRLVNYSYLLLKRNVFELRVTLRYERLELVVMGRKAACLSFVELLLKRVTFQYTCSLVTRKLQMFCNTIHVNNIRAQNYE